MKFFNKNFLEKRKKNYRNFLSFTERITKENLKENIFYYFGAVCTILVIVIILLFQFSKDSQQKTASFSAIHTNSEKNSTKLEGSSDEFFFLKTPPLSSLQSKRATNNNLAAVVELETTNKITQREEILKLLEKVHFKKQSKMVIIIDDFGYSKSKVELFLKITQPITFAVLPNLPNSSAIANSFHQKNKPILVHLPMEPNNLQQKIEKITLMVSDSRKEIKDKLVLSLESAPFSIGVNNHMGSKFTRHEEGMELLMQYLQKHKLFFLDSKTSSGRIAVKLSQKYGVPYFSRDVFLDNSNEMLAIAKQLIKALEISFKKGNVIVIGHPYLSTYEVLQILLPEFEKKGVLFTSLENFQPSNDL